MATDTLSDRSIALIAAHCKPDQLEGWGRGYGMSIYGQDLQRLLDAAFLTPPDLSPERLEKAIEQADDHFGYVMELTRLVDGVHTYTLTISGEPPLEFEELDVLHEHVRIAKNKARTTAILAALYPT